MQYFEEIKNVNVEDIEIVAKGISQGKIAIFPTETVYGIGTSAFDERACKKIYEMKKRPNDKPLIVLVLDKEMLFDIVQKTNDIENKLIDKFWPGPLTIIFEKKDNGKLPNVVTSGKNSVGVRMTDGKIAQLLLKKSGVPIVAPSANLSGMPSGTRMSNIIEAFGEKVDYILDCGDIEDTTTSTIVKVEGDIIYVLRQGKISKQDLETVGQVTVI